jgi:hypothetical protein
MMYGVLENYPGDFFGRIADLSKVDPAQINDCRNPGIE